MINNQYLIVQEGLKENQKGSKQRRRNNTANQNAYDWTNISGPVVMHDDIADKDKLIDGDDTYHSKLYNETLNSLDQTTFLRHGDISDVDFKVQLNFIRDFKNLLELITKDEEIIFVEQLERDVTRQ